jgi:hypothetical protein
MRVVACVSVRVNIHTYIYIYVNLCARDRVVAIACASACVCVCACVGACVYLRASACGQSRGACHTGRKHELDLGLFLEFLAVVRGSSASGIAPTATPPRPGGSCRHSGTSCTRYSCRATSCATPTTRAVPLRVPKPDRPPLASSQGHPPMRQQRRQTPLPRPSLRLPWKHAWTLQKFR